jgi:CBS domain-containing protein
MNDIKVRDVMTHLVVTCRPQDHVAEAARKLVSNHISGAPVVQDGRLVGVVSEADLVGVYTPPSDSQVRLPITDPLMHVLHGSRPHPHHPRTVADVMTRDVVSISAEASVWAAASLMDRHAVRRLPVLDDEGFVIGVLARADLVRAMARSDEDIALSARRAVELLGPENFTSLEVHASDGVVTLRGAADRKTTRDLARRLALHVPGVLEVVDELVWEWDDTGVKPVPNLPEAGRDPWAVGPLVRETN